MTERFLIPTIPESRNRLAADDDDAVDAVDVVETVVEAVVEAEAEAEAVVEAEAVLEAVEAEAVEAAVVGAGAMPARIVRGRTFRFSRGSSRVYWSCTPRDTDSCVIPRRTMPHRIRIRLCRVLWSSVLRCGLVGRSRATWARGPRARGLG
jgi:hypothetical protein